jgi:O-succinylbenzoic acid--CoA ligase
VEALADEQGWWRSTDRVRLSGRELRFAGRADRVVKVLGELVNLEAVERALGAAGLPSGCFAVVALPEARRGAELVLVWQQSAAAGSAPPEEVLIRYTQAAAPFAKIRQVKLVPQIPRSPLGKIRYEELAALILGEVPR